MENLYRIWAYQSLIYVKAHAGTTVMADSNFGRCWQPLRSALRILPDGL
jgi:hypothetical protein